MMGNLPCERLSIRKHPFSCTGVDFFGPLFVEIRKGTRISSGTGKRFGVIFTCLTTRACYIDLAGASSTDSFLLAFRRFTSRRGKPRLIRSNNGTNFVGAERESREALDKLNQQKTTSTLSEDGIESRFNTPLAPWMGGAVESMVKLTEKKL